MKSSQINTPGTITTNYEDLNPCDRRDKRRRRDARALDTSSGDPPEHDPKKGQLRDRQIPVTFHAELSLFASSDREQGYLAQQVPNPHFQKFFRIYSLCLVSCQSNIKCTGSVPRSLLASKRALWIEVATSKPSLGHSSAAHSRISVIGKPSKCNDPMIAYGIVSLVDIQRNDSIPLSGADKSVITGKVGLYRVRVSSLLLHSSLHLFRSHFLLERRNGPHVP